MKKDFEWQKVHAMTYGASAQPTLRVNHVMSLFLANAAIIITSNTISKAEMTSNKISSKKINSKINCTGFHRVNQKRPFKK